MRLVGLRVTDFRCVHAAELRFDGDGLVAVSGKNGHGKSSVLDALAFAFGGPRAVPATSTPIRHGAKSADVVVETSTFTLERRATPSGQRFVVRGRDGVELKTSQAALDAMYSALTFDPLAFARMKPPDQRAALIAALGLEGELARIDAERKRAFDERTIAGRTMKAERAKFDALPEPDPFTPAEEQSAGELVAAIGAAREAHDANGRIERGIDEDERQIERWRGEIAMLEASITEVGERLLVNRARLAEVAVLPDVAALQEKLDKLEETNRAARAAKAWRAQRAELEAAESEHSALDAAVNGFDAARRELIAGVELPVEGLEIHEDGLSLAGVPLGQASTAETIRLGCAVAVAQKPQLRVLRIAEGSLLDSETRAAIDELARANGYLVLVEMVADEPSGDPGEIWIEDGATAPV
ncbi:MAG: AAA family ATPase [Deltaproteobacteria bacterium]|nr:AAA family ATPase [Deltaproteobacteria bacterium]